MLIHAREEIGKWEIHAAGFPGVEMDPNERGRISEAAQG